jgi:hypothetical protein
MRYNGVGCDVDQRNSRPRYRYRPMEWSSYRQLIMVLTLTFCLQLSATACLYPQYPLDPTSPYPFHCNRAAQGLAAEWLKLHPGYVLKRAECRPAAKAQIDV